jgi:hypothetical protein
MSISKCYTRVIPTRLIINSEFSSFIEEKIIAANNIVRESYQFIRAYFLFLGQNKLEFPEIDLSFFKSVFKCVSWVKNRGRVPPMYKTLLKFYKQHYESTQIVRYYSPSRKMMEAEAVQMLTGINNHIQGHFYDYVKGLVFTVIPKEMEPITVRNAKRRKLLNDLFNDPCITEESNDSDKEYLDLIIRFAPYIKEIKGKIKHNPQIALPLLFEINEERESLGAKVLSFLSLRTSLIPCSIQLHKTICDTDFKKPELWESITENVEKYFEPKEGYMFSSIRVNGVSCSILFKSETKYKESEVLPPKELYVEDLTRKQIDKWDLTIKAIIGGDPGKNNLIQLTNGDRFMGLKNTQRKYETGSSKYRKIRLRREETCPGLKQALEELKNYSSRTMDFDSFMEYVEAKNRFVDTYEYFYLEIWHRKFKWKTFINNKRSIDNFLNRFETTFGSPHTTVLAIGDWEQRQGISFGKEPTMGVGIRNWFRKRGYMVLLVGEQATSKTCHKCYSENEYNWLQRPDPRPWKRTFDDKCCCTHTQDVWGLSRCTNSQCRTVHNRDKNAAKNILNKAMAYINDVYHPIFRPAPLGFNDVSEPVGRQQIIVPEALAVSPQG